MWPFSSATSSKRDALELEELNGKFRELEQRFKVIEREHEDLHRAYRRLRATNAAEARETPRQTNLRDPSGNGEDPPRPLTKQELRAKFLTPGLARPRGNPESD